MKIITQQEVEKRIYEQMPNWHFEILEYTRMTKPFIIKCLECGKIYSVEKTTNFIEWHRGWGCSCKKPEETLSHIERSERNKQKILQLIADNPYQEFVSFDKHTTEKEYTYITVKVKCLKCGDVFSKRTQAYLLNQQCQFCENAHDLTTSGYKLKVPEEYEVVGEYTGADNRILVRHKLCGFIWNPIAKKLLHYSGCPKCNKAHSKGESRIEKYLIERNITHIREYRPSWSSNRRFSYDFFLPDYNLIIEYHGEQHYQPVPHFGGQEKFEYRQKLDDIKQREAIEAGVRYLIIPYTEYKNVNTILTNWFNDYSFGK